MKQLFGEINAVLRAIKADIYFQPEMYLNKLFFEAGGEYQLRFHAPIAYMLGVKAGEWINFEIGRKPLPMDIKAGFYMIYCYSDVVEQQIVGDSYAPLLRTIKVNGEFRDIITQTFNPADYLPVARKHIESIQI